MTSRDITRLSAGSTERDEDTRRRHATKTRDEDTRRRRRPRIREWLRATDDGGGGGRAESRAITWGVGGLHDIMEHVITPTSVACACRAPLRATIWACVCVSYMTSRGRRRHLGRARVGPRAGVREEAVLERHLRHAVSPERHVTVIGTWSYERGSPHSNGDRVAWFCAS